jgi:hypothetical protein
MKLLKYNSLSLIAFLFCFATITKAQPYFQFYDSVPVSSNGSTFVMPWVGGLNFIQASNVDLNLDGTKDLVVFDRTGNKLRTFLHKPIASSTEYTYAPEYESKFPELLYWALLLDFNCDGKEDIFTYSTVGGGFDVYKNISTVTSGLQFQKIVTQQKSIYNPDYPPPIGNPYNLYVSSVDIPAFSDIDNDGDIDVVTFAITGTFVEYHQNQSVENGFGCDSLIFKVKNHCWGYASEASLTNQFTLNDSCSSNVINSGIIDYQTNPQALRSAERHSGNCELCLDLNGDGTKELIVGSISYPNATMLTNNGTPTASNFSAIDTLFPENNSNTNGIDLSIFPCGYVVDINNDGVKDMLVSPNAANVSENFKSVWYYQNVGSNSVPDYEFQQTNFLQSRMIDLGEGAYPVLFDYDNDGLKDLFVGNSGYYRNLNYQHSIAYFKNNGTTSQPSFELITRDFNNYSTLPLKSMYPAFGDMDADGDADMIIGSDDGHIHYFTNTAGVGNPCNFILTGPDYLNTAGNVIDIGSNATPQIFDVDNDGKNDVIIGGRNGKVTYYRHVGSATAANPSLDSITNAFGNVRVNQFQYSTGYCVPKLIKINNITKLLCGNERGSLHLYDNIDGNINGSFNLIDSTYLNIKQGSRTAPTFADMNNDGFLDLVLGNYQGGLTYYKGTSSMVGIEENNLSLAFDVFPNPANTYIYLNINNTQEATYELEIINLLGEKIISRKISNTQNTIDVEQLSNGVYFVCLIAKSKGKSLTKKIVIVK